jgi:competence protein ComEA
MGLFATPDRLPPYILQQDGMMSDWFERNRGFVLVTLINLALIGGLAFWLRRPDPSPIEIVPPQATATPDLTPTPTPSPLRIYVTGAVLHPDVYFLAPGSIVKDAVQAAGGVTGDADLVGINLAQELQDQQQVYVPHAGEVEPPPPVRGGEPESLPGSRAMDIKIDINTATAEQLDSLPGIGPAFAQRIIEYRETNGPFKSIEDITLVSGIGDATFAKIRDLITVQ